MDNIESLQSSVRTKCSYIMGILIKDGDVDAINAFTSLVATLIEAQELDVRKRTLDSREQDIAHRETKVMVGADRFSVIEEDLYDLLVKHGIITSWET